MFETYRYCSSDCTGTRNGEDCGCLHSNAKVITMRLAARKATGAELALDAHENRND